MKQKLSFQKALFILLVVSGGFLGSLWLYQKLDKDSGIRDELFFYQKIEEIKPDLALYWHEGDFSQELEKKQFNCPKLHSKLKTVDSSFLQCNLDFIKCLIKNKTDWKGITLSKPSYYSQSLEQQTLPNSFGLKILATYKDYKANLFLKAPCNEVMLPQRVYVDNDDWSWDNFKRNILIDRFLVSNRMIKDWLSYNKEIKLSIDDADLDFPATNLSIAQRKLFCRWQGKQLLESKVLIAATNLPSKRNDPRNRYNKLYRYPWTKNAKINKDLSWSNCSRLMSEDCLKKHTYKPFSTASVSWAGLYQVSGGYPESLQNFRRPKENVKTSSFYFKHISPNQYLSARAYWNGDLKTDFSFSSSMRSRSKYQESKRKIGFRCMREI